MTAVCAYIQRIDDWPDNWAASRRRFRLRTFQHFPKSTIRGMATRLRAPIPRAHPAKGRFPMTAGTVKFYNGRKGFGFIAPDNGEKDIFVHATALERAGISELREGQKVKFDTENDPRSGKIAVATIELA
jgi:cold shock protein